jgi:hypothetical protein
VERKEKERIEKETEEKRRAAVKKYKMEIEKNTRGEERMIEESRLNKKRVDYINTYGINSFEKLTEAEKQICIRVSSYFILHIRKFYQYYFHSISPTQIRIIFSINL